MGLSSVSKLLALVPIALLGLGFRQGATPDDAINGFVSAWNEMNLKKASGFVVGGKIDADFTHMQDAMSKQWVKVAVTNLKTETTGDKAKSTFHVKLSMSTNETIPEKDESVDLVRVDGKWLIVPATQADMAGREPKSYVGALAMITTDPGVFDQAHKAAESTSCLSNVKQLALAALMLANDNDDKFKLDLSHVKATFHPYLKNDQLWYCPSGPKDQVAYTFNASLANKSETEIAEPANTVMIYEGTKGQLNFRHSGRAAVAFADGHAKLINAEQAKTLRWKP